MTAKRWLLSLVVGFHFAIVLSGACKLQLPSFGPLNRFVALYMGFSGANYSWGFFAPNIGSQYKTDFVVHRADGSVVRESLGSEGPNESLIRRAGVAATFWFGMKDTNVRRSLTASWAADEFTRWPDARRVDVDISGWYLPSQAQIRASVMPRWIPIYHAGFERQMVGDAR